MVDCFPLYLKIRVIYFSRIQFLVTCNAAALFNYKIWFFDFGPKRRFGRLCFVFVFFHWFKATRSSQVPLKPIDGRRKRPEFPFLDCGATSSACKLTRQVNCWFEELAKVNCSLTCFGTTLWPAASGNKIIGGIFFERNVWKVATWASVSPRVAASCLRSGLVMYFCSWNRFSRPLRCKLEKTALDHDLLRLAALELLPLPPPLPPLPECCTTALGDRIDSADSADSVGIQQYLRFCFLKINLT